MNRLLLLIVLMGFGILLPVWNSSAEVVYETNPPTKAEAKLKKGKNKASKRRKQQSKHPKKTKNNPMQRSWGVAYIALGAAALINVIQFLLLLVLYALNAVSPPVSVLGYILMGILLLAGIFMLILGSKMIDRSYIQYSKDNSSARERKRSRMFSELLFGAVMLIFGLAALVFLMVTIGTFLLIFGFALLIYGLLKIEQLKRMKEADKNSPENYND